MGSAADSVQRLSQLVPIVSVTRSNVVWKNNPIARLKKGHNYLDPIIEIVADESLQLETKLKLEEFLATYLF